ncbi:hypothetical protein M9Y10_024394 [Tritrichomonas musculus]|uniref:VWFA domain-containing protein n=1 Tax=Tritrichomonas musculus TaxID=1915356 RepID=A0ABR2HCT7_9EUKA
MRRIKRKEANILFLIDATKCNIDNLSSIFWEVVDTAYDFYASERSYHFSYSSICYTDEGQPLIRDFNDDIEEFSNYLDEKIDFINNLPGEPITTPIDYSNLLMTCYTNLHKRKGQKMMVWIASRPALGERFCGEVGHHKEEEKLVHILQEFFKDVDFLCLYLNKRAQKMFDEMQSIHQDNSNNQFNINDFGKRRKNRFS